MKTILVICDDSESKRTLDEILVFAGYDVVSLAYDPAAIAEALFTVKAILVLLDIGLSLKTVEDLCRQIRTELRNVPIFVLGTLGQVDIVVLLDLGADDYITKPFHTSELLARVRARTR
jgi:DNA-binding response OmpR family regulator